LTFIHESDNPEELLSIWEKENKDASIFESDEVNFFSGEQNTAKGSLFLAVEYSFIQYYLANKPSIKLLALYFYHDKNIYFTVTASDEFLRTNFSLLSPSFDSIKDFLSNNKLPFLRLDQPLALKPVNIEKPWGQEIWYTGIEQRGISSVTDGIYDSPLPWVLSAAPKRLTAGREKQINLLKILDPAPEPLFGDLYFELHEKKQEVYVVVDIDEQCWPQKIGGMRYGFNDELKNTFSSEKDFHKAYKKAVKKYSKIRQVIDARLDSYRALEGYAFNEALPISVISKWMTLIPDDWIYEEKKLRSELNHFSSILSLKVGDVIKIPLLTPHGLLHGVRVVEFQNPVYERLILSFNQKTLTQDHWDTDKALSIMTERIDPFSELTIIEKNLNHTIEVVAVFDDFKVSRITLSSKSSLSLTADKNYKLLLVIEGSIDCNSIVAIKECGLFLPSYQKEIAIKNINDNQSVILIASPIHN
jgi:hypothetical protein